MNATAYLSRLRSLWESSEKARFLVVGAYTTAFGYGAFASAYLLLHPRLNNEVILVLAYMVSVCNAFAAHRRLVFRVRGHLAADFVRFNLTQLGALLFNLAALPVLDFLGIHPLISVAGLLVISVTASYVLHRRVSFRR